MTLYETDIILFPLRQFKLNSSDIFNKEKKNVYFQYAILSLYFQYANLIVLDQLDALFSASAFLSLFQSLSPAGSSVSSSMLPVPATNCSYVCFSSKSLGPKYVGDIP